MQVGFIYDEIFLRHKAPLHHPEREERLISILNVLKSSEIWDRLIHIKPRPAEYSDIALVHSLEHIERIKKNSSAYLDPDTYMSNNSFEAAIYAAGAVIEAIDRCKSGEIGMAFCAVRPPGHHAEAGRAMGFCLFNNVAIGARYAQKIGYKRVFIIDFDVHHGNGTQHIFEEDDTVFYFSAHQFPHYPGTGAETERGIGNGEGCTCNIPMRAGSGDREYLEIFQDILPKLVRQFSPDIIFVSAGYDICREDPLSAIRISDEGINGIVRGILSCSEIKTDKPPIPVIFALEGGYNLDALAGSVRTTIEEMLGH
ncbi:MAG: histone deacetylase [Nitrospirae bacterium]|nr:histone deacetylase [Nitrospirota bacterium]